MNINIHNLGKTYLKLYNLMTLLCRLPTLQTTRKQDFVQPNFFFLSQICSNLFESHPFFFKVGCK